MQKLSDARLAELEGFAAGHRGLGIKVTHIEIDDLGALLAEVREARKLAELGTFARSVAAVTPCSCSGQRRRAQEAEAKLARIASAYNNPGSHPDYHERVKGFTRRDWPTLTAAIEAAIGKETHGR